VAAWLHDCGKVTTPEYVVDKATKLETIYNRIHEILLNKLEFPDYLANVPEFAGAHHETMIGTGYPRGLKKEEISIPARIMAIADIFEALTAADRPYKKPKTLNEALRIMSFMRNDQHIDADLFLKSGVYQEYAEQHLDPAQIDVVDIHQYLSSTIP